MPGMGMFFPTTCKRKFRWLFYIDGVSDGGVSALPPMKSARPSVSFKEVEVKHVTETVYFPGRAEWKPINLVLYDVSVGNNIVFNWLQKAYNAANGTWRPIADSGMLKDAYLELYDGCGNVLEKWLFEQAWPQQIEFGDLDMGSTDIVTCDITLRYARAYIL